MVQWKNALDNRVCNGGSYRDCCSSVACREQPRTAGLHRGRIIVIHFCISNNILVIGHIQQYMWVNVSSFSTCSKFIISFSQKLHVNSSTSLCFSILKRELYFYLTGKTSLVLGPSSLEVQLSSMGCSETHFAASCVEPDRDECG